jgi:hypothetical protein
LAKLLVPNERFLDCCEDFYKRDGFVKWSDVARALGITRQAVQIRVNKLREIGELDEATFERYQSMSSRRAAAKRNRELSRDLEQRTPRVQFTPENFAWLRKECELRQITIADIVNGLVNKARVPTVEN